MKIEREYRTLADICQTEEAFRARCSQGYDYQPATDEPTMELFHLLWLRYQKSIIGYIDAYYDHGELIATEMNDIEALYDKINYVYLTTKDRFTLLLSTYKSNRDKLLSEVSTSVTTRFNDTPQDSGDWLDDRHTTNITQQVQGTDYMPLMDRISAIEAKYHALMHRWVEQFNSLLGGGEIEYA